MNKALHGEPFMGAAAAMLETLVTAVHYILILLVRKCIDCFFCNDPVYFSFDHIIDGCYGNYIATMMVGNKSKIELGGTEE